MIFEDCLVAALANVLDWEFPDEACPGAVMNQACMLAGMVPDDFPERLVN